MRRLYPNRSNVDDLLNNNVLNAELANTKLPDRGLAEKGGYEVR
jgi:hypothetical protein